MRKKWRMGILAAVLSIPLALQIPDWTVNAGEENTARIDNMEEIHTEETYADIEGHIEEETAEEDHKKDQGDENTGQGDEEPKDVFEGMVTEDVTTEDEIFFAGSEEMEEMENAELLSEEETDDLLSLYAVPVNFVQEGSPVRDGAIGFTPVAIGDRQYSSKYTRLGWNSDSQVIPWNNAGENVVQGRRYGGDVQGPYFVPLNTDAKGKFGFRVTNAGFNKAAGTKVDLLLTCTNYRTYSYDYQGNKITDLYPLFGMGEDKEIWILFKEELPLQEIRVDIVKSGTSTPVAGNYRFRWLDIDLYQRFGFRLQNGTIGNRYATRNSVINAYVKNVFSRSYEILTAPAPEVQGEVPENTVVYEIDGSSGFYLTILAPGYDKHSIETSAKIQKVYNEVITGKTKYSAGLNWDSKGYGPIEYPQIVKKTGNTLEKQQDSNTLENCESAYFYTLQTDIPEELPDYYYSSCVVNDSLPAGVDYNGYAAVKMLPSEMDVSSWFQISTENDVIRFTATANALASGDFYGKTFEFQIGVKMDPTEIQPVYSGDNYTYTVKNAASITCKHKNTKEGVNQSNEVKTTYTGTKRRVTSSVVNKYTANQIDGQWDTQIQLPSVDSTYKYKLSVQVPENEYGGYLTSFEIKDTLPEGIQLETGNIQIYRNGTENVTTDFQIRVDGRTVLINPAQGVLNTAVFYGKTYEVILFAKLIPAQLTPLYQGNTAVYSVKNMFQIITAHKGDSQNSTLDSNTVTTKANVVRAETSKPEKWILDGNQRVLEKEYQNRTFETDFLIIQQIPAYAREWKIKKLTITDTLESCLEVRSANVYVNDEQKAVFGGSNGSFEGWNFIVEGGTIKLWINDPEENCYGKTVKLQLHVGLKEDCNLSSYYENNPTSENLVARVPNKAKSTLEWNHGTPVLVSGDTQTVELCIIEKIPKGKIVIRKENNAGKPLKDAVFQIIAAETIYAADKRVLVQADTVVGEVTTDENGTGTSGELYTGKYVIKETKPPLGYTINKTAQTIEVLPDITHVANVKNEETVIKIRKISQVERETDIPEVIPGAVFRIWRKEESSEKGKNYTTDENGMIEIKGLLPGTYCVQEEQTIEGYVLDPAVFEFTMSDTGLVNDEAEYVYEIKNAFIKAEFLKVDKATGDAVAGALMQLTDENGTVVDTWTSEKTAHRINRLRCGTYILTELKAPEGYQKGAPIKCVVQERSSVQKFRLANVKMVQIKIEKVIHGKEIVWAHGNPVFTFQVEGRDLDGKERIYFDTVEFTQEDDAPESDIQKTLLFTVPAGMYTVCEKKTLRYELEKIEKVRNGTVKDQKVEFDLRKNQRGSAVFVNKKINDSYLTDTGFVRNTVIKEKNK